LIAPAAGGIVPGETSKRQFVGGALLAVALSILLGWGAFYGLNRYLGPINDPPTTTGSVRRAPTN
jgi:hypothetical protein